LVGRRSTKKTIQKKKEKRDLYLFCYRDSWLRARLSAQKRWTFCQGRVRPKKKFFFFLFFFLKQQQYSEREDAVAVFHPRGIVILSSGTSRGLMEAFSYKAMKSFGATDEACFGFRVHLKNISNDVAPAPKSPRGGKPADADAADDAFVCLVNRKRRRKEKIFRVFV
jgi:hypothetical protein